MSEAAIDFGPTPPNSLPSPAELGLPIPEVAVKALSPVVVELKKFHEKAKAGYDMRLAATSYLAAVEAVDPIEPDNPADRLTTVSWRDAEPTSIGDWTVRTSVYSSRDPYQELNPELTAAANAYIDTAIEVAHRFEGSGDSTLTYLNTRRSKGGSKPTLVTSEVLSLDPEGGLTDWMKRLPDPECLQPVAHPWSDSETLLIDPVTGGNRLIPSTRAQLPIMGGSNDGRGVRERSAWEVAYIRELSKNGQLPDGVLHIASIGTGTGEPIMDVGLEVLPDIGADSLVVHGADINPRSLRVAEIIARRKSAKVEFRPTRANLLSEADVIAYVSSLPPGIWEAVGFNEYAASENPEAPEMERQQWKQLQRFGLMSSERLHKIIFEHMPKGTTFLTGNMRTDSRQVDFVTQGLGWQGIIPRSTEQYLSIIKNAGIPAENVHLFVPDPQQSAAVYNLLAITKSL